VLFLPDLIQSTASAAEDTEYLLPFLLQDSTFCHVVPAKTGIPAKIFDLARQIHGELPAASARARICVKTYLKMILVLLLNHYATQLGTRKIFERKQRAITRLQPLFDFLERHYSQPITVRDAAQVIGMSRSHFTSYFKDVTGQSLIAHLNQFRIAKALVLLASTDRSIAQICQEVGICDQSYFGVLFRRFTNMTPSQYKRKRSESL
jgi:AraC-like DNA-binding protein